MRVVYDLPEGFPNDTTDIFVLLNSDIIMDRRQVGELLSLVNPIGATAVVVGRMVEDFEVRTIIHTT